MVAQDIILKPILSEKSYADIANKKYYFKVRAYKVFNGKNVYGNLSKIKSVKVK